MHTLCALEILMDDSEEEVAEGEVRRLSVSEQAARSAAQAVCVLSCDFCPPVISQQALG